MKKDTIRKLAGIIMMIVSLLAIIGCAVCNYVYPDIYHNEIVLTTLVAYTGLIFSIPMMKP